MALLLNVGSLETEVQQLTSQLTSLEDILFNLDFELTSTKFNMDIIEGLREQIGLLSEEVNRLKSTKEYIEAYEEAYLG